MTNEFIDYFHQDTKRTFPKSTVDHMAKMMMYLCEATEQGPSVLLKNMAESMTTGIMADYVKASVFYNKEKNPREEYAKLIEGIGNHSEATMSDEIVQVLHGYLGIVSENAELASAIMKGLSNNGVFDVINIKEEIGDIVVYAAAIGNGLGFTLEEAMKANIAKRAKRFPDGFTEFHAVNRDTNAERIILEGDHA